MRTSLDFPDSPLYKFMSLKDGQSPSWHARLLQLLSGKCFLSSPLDFNDPFDCLPFIKTPDDGHDLEAWLEAMVGPMAEAVRQDLPAPFVRQQIRDRFSTLQQDEIREKLQRSSRLFAEKMGVFCLAECIDSVLMWSHYASNHKGIAVKFEFEKDPQSKLMPLWRVSYEEQRPIITSIVDKTALPLADALAIKAQFWRYEREWRAIKPETAGKMLDFDPVVITGLVLGANCSSDDEELLRRLIAGHSLDIFRMKPGRDTFALEMVEARTDSPGA